MSQEVLIEESVMAMNTAEAQTSGDGPEGPGPLDLRELVIDVRKTDFTVTAEAASMPCVGVNLVRHATNNAKLDVNDLINSLIESMEALGITADRYRVVREDLPCEVPVEIRTPAAASA